MPLRKGDADSGCTCVALCVCLWHASVCVLLSEMTSTVKAFHFINKICVLMFLQTLDILMPHFGKWSVGVGVEF